MVFDDAALRPVREDAEGAFPEESVGALFYGHVRGPDEGPPAEYIPLRNVAPDPRRGFRIEDELLRAYRARRPHRRVAIVHSHPAPWPACPSELDMRSQIASALPWGIVPVGEDGVAGDPFFWGADVPRPPLVGRPYRHGVTDCFSVVRDFFRLGGVHLHDVPRGPDWYKRRNLLDLCKSEFGAMELPLAAASVGDVLLMQIATPHVSQLAVIVEPGVILIHPGAERPYDPQRLSKREPIGRWQPYVRHLVRHPLAREMGLGPIGSTPTGHA